MYNIDTDRHIPMYMDIDRQIEVGGGVLLVSMGLTSK